MLEAAIFGLPPLTEKEIVQRNAELDAKYRNLFSRVFEYRPREDPVIARMWELTGKPFSKDMEEQAQGSDKFRAVNCPREPEEGDGAPPASLSMTHTRQGQQTVTGNLQGGESVDKSVAIPNDIDEDLPLYQNVNDQHQRPLPTQPWSQNESEANGSGFPGEEGAVRGSVRTRSPMELPYRVPKRSGRKQRV